MGTIARLVVEIGANVAPVKVALDQANGYLRQFARTTEQSIGIINKGLKSGAIRNDASGTAADVLLHNLNQKFEKGVGQVREQLFRGILDPEAAKKYAREAAASYNAGLLGGLEQLRGRNLLPPEKLLEMQRSLKVAGLNNGKEITDGMKAAKDAAGTLLNTLNAQFQQGTGKIREQLFKGIISKEEAAKRAGDAALGFNSGLLDGIQQLRGKNLLPPEIAVDLQNKLKAAGLRSGNEFINGLSDRMHQSGSKLVAAGEFLTKSITLPLVGAGGLASKFAGEAEIAAGRMKIVWGPMTEEIEVGLQKLHKSIPATTTELRNMSAITSELLLPLGILPKTVKEISLDFIGLSKDLSILNNVSPERTIHALQSSLVGMTRPLKLLGVDITDLGIKQEAQILGLVKEGQTLNETGKAIAAYSLVMKRAALIQSAAAKLSETFLVQMRFLKRDAVEVGIAVGTKINPVMLPLVKRLRELIVAFGELSPTTLKWIVSLALAAAAIGPMAILIGKLTLAFRLLFVAINLVRTKGWLALAATIASNPIALAIVAIATAVGLLYLATRNAAESLKEFQAQAAKLDKNQADRNVKNNAARMRQLEQERATLLKMPQQTTRTINTGRSTITQTFDTDAGQRVKFINSELKTRADLALAVGERFQQIARDERQAEDDLQHWQDKMDEFAKRGETAFDKVKKSIDKLRDSVQLTIDRLNLFRELDLDISEPLSKAQSKYDDLLKSQGGLNNLVNAEADVLQLILQLRKSINDAKNEQVTKPVEATIDQLELTSELGLDISEPLARAQVQYDELLKSQGGLNNLANINKDIVSAILNLQKKINDAKNEQAQKPIDDARNALETLRNVRETAIDTVNLDVSVVQAAFEEARVQLDALDKAIAKAGKTATPEAIRLSTALHRLLGSTTSFVETITDDLIGIANLGRDLPISAAESGLRELFNSINATSESNAKRFATLRNSFGLSVTTPEGTTPGINLAGAALDLLQSAALDVAEQFTPLAILAKLVSSFLEPVMVGLQALLLPLQIVARIFGTLLLPVLKILFPVFKYLAIAATYVGEVFARISSAILRAIGSLVRGIGNLINKLPGSPGDPLVKAGQAMLDLADSYTRTADDLARARDELRDLTFEDAMDQVNGLAKAARDASQNIPQIFKTMSKVFEAANPYTPPPIVPPVPYVPPPIVPPTQYVPPVTPGGGGGSDRAIPRGAGPIGTSYIFQAGAIVIEGTGKSTRVLVDEVESEIDRRRVAQLGAL